MPVLSSGKFDDEEQERKFVDYYNNVVFPRVANPGGRTAPLPGPSPRPYDIVADLRPDTTSLKMEFEDVWAMVEKCMPERDQQILRSIYFDGKMLKTIAKEMGLLSGTTICKCHADAIDHLRYIFQDDREAA